MKPHVVRFVAVVAKVRGRWHCSWGRGVGWGTLAGFLERQKARDSAWGLMAGSRMDDVCVKEREDGDDGCEEVVITRRGRKRVKERERERERESLSFVFWGRKRWGGSGRAEKLPSGASSV